MDRERVIKGLHRHCEGSMFDRCGECPYYNVADESFQCRDALLADALALLKEQEQQKQIVRKQCKKEHEDGSIDYFAEWYCPHCNSLILRGFDNPSIKFCYKCGKPIKWEGR